MEMILRYDKAADSFIEALPIGNGSLGAMVYGGVPFEKISLNLDTLWSGTARRRIDEVPYEILEEAKKKSLCGEYYEAQKIVEEKMLGRYNESYMPLGVINYEYKNLSDISSYQRSLDLEEAIVRTSFTSDGKKYSSEIFASYPKKAIFIKLESEVEMALSFSLDSLLRYKKTSSSTGIGLKGNAPSHVEPNYIDCENPVIYDDKNLGMDFFAHLTVLSCDGHYFVEENSINISGAKSVVLAFAASDSYLRGECRIADEEYAKNKLDSILTTIDNIPYVNILNEHLSDYQNIFLRSILKISDEKNNLTVDKRLEEFRAGKEDLGLYSLYYHYNRYLLIASSREGSQPANLQGIWSESLRPVWSSNWTININTQMNYWQAGICNLMDCYEPLLKFVKEISISGSELAKKRFHTRGWVANHNIDIWRNVEPVGGKARFAYWPMGGVWLAVQIFDYYKYTCDKDFLESFIYPIMRGSALFCIDWLNFGEDGLYHTPISTSPENEFVDDDGNVSAVSYSSTMDIVLIKELFKNIKLALKVLGKNDTILEDIDKISLKLPAYKVDKSGRLMEWVYDFQDLEMGHRHFSPLLGFFPFTNINKYDSPELIDAVEKFVDRRLKYSKKHIGWSCAWLINIYARLEKGDLALEFLDDMLINSSYDNLFDLHPPLGEGVGEREVFQIDGNLGAASGIANMLLNSSCGKIELLPALPSKWKKGEVTGLLAEGNIGVSLKWLEGKLVSANIISPYEQKICLKCGENEYDIFLKSDEVYTFTV